VIVLEPEVDGV
jgi:hypothetical protein